MSNLVKAAVVQAASVAFDTAATLDKLERLAKEAAAKGARIAVFPEAFIGGYPKGADFGARVGMRSEQGRAAFQRYFEAAISVPGPEMKRIGEIAVANAINLVVGIIERDGGTLYCTVIYVDADGRLLGKHRKLMPTAMERLIWGFGDGSTLDAVDTDVGRVGALICWENYMPMARMAMYAQGVELYCAPTVDDRDAWLTTMRHVAYEGRCFVLAACQFATRADFPDDYECIQGNAPETVMIRGGSAIIDPFGQLLAGPIYDEEAVVVADLDMGAIARGKYDLDVAGHYARWDVFNLTISDGPGD